MLQAHPLRLVDLGAGSGWLCYRAALAGIYCLAVDVRDDTIDGLGAAECYMRLTRFDRAVASFDALPLPDRYFDVAVFNASLHYALDLTTVLGEASRVVKRGGRLVILDSPFYAREAHGEAMVAEKRRDAEHRFGPRAEALTTLPFAEYLTRGRLKAASAGLGLVWRRRRVRYPVWYETRRLFAWLHRRRSPSRFDLWESTVI